MPEAIPETGLRTRMHAPICQLRFSPLTCSTRYCRFREYKLCGLLARDPLSLLSGLTILYILPAPLQRPAQLERMSSEIQPNDLLVTCDGRQIEGK
jgi:hypothetical protein